MKKCCYNVLCVLQFNFIIIMPPQTQYLPVAEISQTHDERNVHQARMSAVFEKIYFCVSSFLYPLSYVIERKRFTGRIRNFLYNKLCYRVNFTFQLFFCVFAEPCYLRSCVMQFFCQVKKCITQPH